MKPSPLGFFLAIVFFTLSGEAFSQTSSAIVNNRLRMVAMGKVDEVRAGMQELMSSFPNDEGVMFLEAITTDNALRALRIYEGIVRNKPRSEWADDAQWRVVQYYALKRDTSRANLELQNYRKNYPNSEFLLSATDIVKATVGFPRGNARTLSSANAATTGNTISRTPPAPKEVIKEPAKELAKEPVKEVLKEPAKTEIPKAEKPNEEIILKPTRYALQIAVYSDHEAAQAEANRFKNKRMRAAVLLKDVEGEKRFAVVIGDYSSRESAEKAQPVVQTQCECAPFIIEK
jgi:cell division septation protein DedD